MDEFIDRVRKHPYLWDTNHTSYRDVNRKDSTWTTIANECELKNGQEAKSMWKKLRDSHREALRRRRTSTVEQPPWKYEHLMTFILPIGHYSTNDETENIEDNIPEVDTEDAIATQIPNYDSEENTTTSRKKKTRTKHINQFQERAKRREQRDDKRDEMRRLLVDGHRNTNEALSDLFSSMCRKTQELPKYLQLRVQREIFESVTRAEEEALACCISSTPNSESSYFGFMKQDDT